VTISTPQAPSFRAGSRRQAAKRIYTSATVW
jgi:hypothetical protein